MTGVAGQYPEVGSGTLPVKDIGRLLLRCGDRPGLVAAVSAFLADAGANIVSLDQHSTEQSGGTFVQRTIFHLPGLTAARDAMEREFGERVATPFEMDFRLTEAAKPKRVAIMASKDDHCLLDLLWRNRRGELDMSVVMVISNHPDLADQVRPFGVPFLHTCLLPKTFGHKQNSANSSCCAATSTWWCWPATCRSSRPSSLPTSGAR